MKRILLAMIRFTGREISPLRPPCCNYIPTCPNTPEATKNTAP